ncbi:beta-hexosaminidase [Prolixibacteraceae bacterium JC049]|nr:beta-hexosaminidase [Prolixibacteraceae bacterium JC049]
MIEIDCISTINFVFLCPLAITKKIKLPMNFIKKLLVLTLLWCASVNVLLASGLPITPYPNNVVLGSGNLNLKSSISLKLQSATFAEEADLFREQVKRFSSFKVKPTKKSNAVISLTEKVGLGEEAYQLVINESGIKVSASTKVGMFNGLQSLLQLLIASENNQLTCCEIEDAPRYPWRGLMLDESRHFFGEIEVKLLIDMMAIHKLNKFHWHLTDSKGWRLEIKQYPKLTTVGATGNQTDPNAKPRFYTQKQIKEVVAYAAKRHIEVIPEIDMPGHASAAARAYPEINGGGSKSHPDFTFHPGKELTFEFLTNVLKEVATLFPSKLIHIGGDEVHFGNHQWKTFPEVKALMKKNNWKSLVDVEHYFLNRMADTLKVMNKTVLGWDEVIGAGLNKNNTAVMWWRHDKKQLLANALKKGYTTIMCPRIPLYFDFVQHDSHTDGRRWGGFASIDKVYAFPNKEMTGDIDADNKLIKGIQANIWTEVIHTNARMEFMTFPRIAALAEAGWTKDQNKNWDEFNARLPQLLQFYQAENIAVFDPLNPNSKPEIKGPAKK